MIAPVYRKLFDPFRDNLRGSRQSFPSYRPPFLCYYYLQQRMDTSVPRKRRRPALSCVQCRRRKVKCDRNNPCGQCMLLRNSDPCTYSSDDRGIVYEQSARPNQGVLSRGRREEGINSNHPLNIYSDHHNPEENINVVQRNSENNVYFHQSHRNIPITPTATSSPSNYSASGPILGTMSKTRIFGRGHWISQLSSVCFRVQSRVYRRLLSLLTDTGRKAAVILRPTGRNGTYAITIDQRSL
jgi:hypothetical protein